MLSGQDASTKKRYILDHCSLRITGKFQYKIMAA